MAHTTLIIGKTIEAPLAAKTLSSPLRERLDDEYDGGLNRVPLSFSRFSRILSLILLILAPSFSFGSVSAFPSAGSARIERKVQTEAMREHDWN